MNKQRSVLFYFVAAIAGIGLLAWIMKEPGNLIKTLLITAVVATVIFFIARAIMRHRMGGGNHDEMRKYRRAVKQSQKRYEHYNPSTNTNRLQNRKQVKRRRRPSHLRLIKGNKTAEKNDKDQASN